MTTSKAAPANPLAAGLLLWSDVHLQNLQQLAAWTRSLAYVTRETPVRLSVAQLTIFALAALGDRMGHPMSLTQLRETLEGTPGGAVHTTYDIFFDERRGQRRLGWLRQERCGLDYRVKWLRLTSKGDDILDAVLQHLSK